MTFPAGMTNDAQEAGAVTVEFKETWGGLWAAMFPGPFGPSDPKRRDPVRPISASVSHGAIIGSAVLAVDLGTAMTTGDMDFEAGTYSIDITDIPPVGSYCRIKLDGSAFWWGTISRIELTQDNLATITCEYITGLLQRSAVVWSNTDAVLDVPVWMARPIGFDPASGTVSDIDVARMAIDAANKPHPSATAGFWALYSDAIAAEIIGKTSLAGRSVHNILTELYHWRNGKTWRVDPETVGLTITIEPVKLATVAPYWTVDADANLAVTDAVVGFAQSASRWSVVTGDRPLVAISLGARVETEQGTFGAIVPQGWEYGAVAKDVVDNADSSVPWQGKEYRVWQVSDTWDGSTYGGTSGIRRPYLQDGTRIETDIWPRFNTLQMEAMTPASAGFGTDVSGARQGATVYLFDGTYWRDISYMRVGITGGPGTQEGGPCGITIGDSAADAQLIARIFAESAIAELVVTVGMREADPLVCWRENTAAPNLQTQRHESHPGMRQHRIIAGCATGVADDALSLTTHAGADITDDTAALDDLALALYAKGLAGKSRCSWKTQVLSASIYPGDRVTSIKIGGTTHAIAANVATIAWDLANGTTTYEAVPVAYREAVGE